MPPSHLLLPLLLLLLRLVLPVGAVEDADCSGSFRAGREHFVLDVEDAAREGGALLKTVQVRSDEACKSACCENPRCSLALLEPRDAGAEDNRTCVLYNCVCRNLFVCRFVNQAGYQSYIRGDVFKKYLQGPGSDDKAPPIANAGRDVVIQPGETVKLNGIQSMVQGDAHITDYHWTLYSGADSVDMETTDHPDQVFLTNLQPGSYFFKLTVTDSNDKSHSAEVNVLVLSPEQSDLYCLAPAKVGPCRGAFTRWRYDGMSGQCEQFVFGGCIANNNNYLTKEDCLFACSGVKASTERSVPPAMMCGDVCHPGLLMCGDDCCVDRSLECDGVEQCSTGADELHCSKLNKTFNRLLDIDVNQRKARCAEPPSTGPCRASFIRYYYDPLTRKCARFTYGGCGGNENNFEKEEKCSSTCEGVTERNVFFRGMFDRFGAEENESDSGNIALAVCLSVAILALLAVLTYCFLKARKDRSQRPVSTGPAHVALSEQDTLVYNPTTKPV